MLDGAGMDTNTRIATARSRLANINQYVPLTDSESAMTVLCQMPSTVRKFEKNVAHKYPNSQGKFNVLKEVMEKILNDPSEKTGMCEIMDFWLESS